MIRELAQALRLRTLPAGAVPVMVGTILAWEAGAGFKPGLFTCTLLFALLVQSTTNLANDYYDFLKGADTEARLGPARVMQQGVVSARWMRWAIAAFLVMTAACGAVLVGVGGLPMLVILFASLLLSLGYTTGPFPLAYLGLGEVFVFVFFGLVATSATFYLATSTWSLKALLCGASLGCISAAMLVANNVRDIDTDRAVNKRTLAVRFGTRFSRLEFSALLILGPLCVLPYVWQYTVSLIVLCLAYALGVLPIISKFLRRRGPELNCSLADTGKWLLLYGGTLCAVLLLTP